MQGNATESKGWGGLELGSIGGTEPSFAKVKRVPQYSPPGNCQELPNVGAARSMGFQKMCDMHLMEWLETVGFLQAKGSGQGQSGMQEWQETGFFQQMDQGVCWASLCAGHWTLRKIRPVARWMIPEGQPVARDRLETCRKAVSRILLLVTFLSAGTKYRQLQLKTWFSLTHILELSGLVWSAGPRQKWPGGRA